MTVKRAVKVRFPFGLWGVSFPHHQLYSSIFNSCDIKDLCEIEVLDLNKRSKNKSKEAFASGRKG